MAGASAGCRPARGVRARVRLGLANPNPSPDPSPNPNQGAAPLEAYEQAARPGAYEPPDSIAWLKEWPGSEPIAELLRQAPPPVRRLPPANARVPIAQLQVPRASDTPDMHRCERVGAWPLILLVGGTLVVLVTSYVVLRVLGFLSWRALGFAYHSVKMVVLIAFKRLKEAC